MICIRFFLLSFEMIFRVSLPETIAMMNAIKLLPCPELQPYICCFISIRSRDSWDNPQLFRIVADGNPGLIFQENRGSFLGNEGEMLPQLFLHGLATKYSNKIATGCYNNTIVCFQPYGIKSIFGLDASELTNTYADLNAVFKTSLAERLYEARSFYDKVKILSEFFLNRMSENKKDPAKIQFITKALNTDHTAACLKNLGLELKISERSLERIVQSYIGIPPKLFSRISRFQSALNCLYHQPLCRLSDIAYTFNYSDQSHYIREFREFSGLTPKQFARQSSPLQNLMA